MCVSVPADGLPRIRMNEPGAVIPGQAGRKRLIFSVLPESIIPEWVQVMVITIKSVLAGKTFFRTLMNTGLTNDINIREYVV